MERILVALLFTGICQVMTAPSPTQQLEDYLYKYGYLPATDAERGVKRSASDLEQATMRLQKFMGLEINGKLDGPTFELLGKARCGMPDMVVKDDGLQGIVEVNDGPANYSNNWRSWSSSDFPITYGFVNYSPDLPESKVISVVDSAVKAWTDVSQLTCEKACDASSADIKISFVTGTHDGCTFDYELAHAYYPGDGIMGDVHFNEYYTFTADTGANYDLLWITVHELGHSFGIGHSEVYGAIMYPYYSYKEGVSLHSDDIAAIQAKYGA